MSRLMLKRSEIIAIPIRELNSDVNLFFLNIFTFRVSNTQSIHHVYTETNHFATNWTEIEELRCNNEKWEVNALKFLHFLSNTARPYHKPADFAPAPARSDRLKDSQFRDLPTCLSQ